MFDIAWSEFLIVAVVALVVVGPKDLPGLLRTVGKTVASLRRMAGDFQSQFNEAMREAELDDLKREVTGLKDAASKLTGGASPFEIARNELKSALEDKPKPPSALSGASETAPASDAPSALAPQLAPLDQPPAPSAADFAYPASKAEPVGSNASKTTAVETVKSAEPPKLTAEANSDTTAAPAAATKVRTAASRKAKTAAPPAAEAIAPKRKTAKKAKPAEPTTPGAAS